MDNNALWMHYYYYMSNGYCIVSGWLYIISHMICRMLCKVLGANFQ